MRIYLKNNPAKFHPDLIWNDGAVKRSLQQEEVQEQQQDNKLGSELAN